MPPWNTNGSEFGQLAKLIMVSESPYIDPYIASSAPEALSKAEQKRLAQVDNRAKYWPYPPGDVMAWVERAFRIPEYIKDDTLDEDKVKTETLEYVVIGVTFDRVTSTVATDFPAIGPSPDNLDKLGRMLVERCVPKPYAGLKKHAAGIVVQDRLNHVPMDWEFRGRVWRMEKIMRIPCVVVRNAADPNGHPGFLLVGYEGAGGY
jgi:hypothetical protein